MGPGQERDCDAQRRGDRIQAQRGHGDRAGAGAARAFRAAIGLLVVGSARIRCIGLAMVMGHPIAMIVRGLMDVSPGPMQVRLCNGRRRLAVGRALPMPVHARQRAAVEHERRHRHEHHTRDQTPKVGPQGVQRFAPAIRK